MMRSIIKITGDKKKINTLDDAEVDTITRCCWNETISIDCKKIVVYFFQ